VRRCTPECRRKLARGGERGDIRIHSSGQPRSDFLKQPGVAVRIAKRSERAIAAPLRVRAIDTAFLATMEHFANVDAVRGKLDARGLDVGDDKKKTGLSPSGLRMASREA
jgi:hypothetical protein